MKDQYKLSLALVSLLAASCTVPSPSGTNAPPAAGVYNDPNNPYAVPGATTQGAYPSTEQVPSYNAPYQPIPATPVNPPASAPSYTPTQSIPSSPSVSSGGATTHTVVSGDSLWGISRKYGVSVDDLRQANNIEGDLIRTGQTLSIPR